MCGARSVLRQRVEAAYNSLPGGSKYECSILRAFWIDKDNVQAEWIIFIFGAEGLLYFLCFVQIHIQGC